MSRTGGGRSENCDLLPALRRRANWRVTPLGRGAADFRSPPAGITVSFYYRKFPSRAREAVPWSHDIPAPSRTRQATLSTFCHEFLDANQRLLHPVRRRGRFAQSRVNNHSAEKSSPRKTKPATKGGLNVRPDEWETLISQIRASQKSGLPVKRKPSFSLTGGFVPIFGPLSAGGLACNPHGEPMSERSLLMLPLANFMPPLPGLAAGGQPQDLCPLPCLARQHDRRGEISAHAEEERGEAVSPGARLRAANAPTRQAGRGDRPQRPRRAACADLRLSQLSPPGGSIRAMRPLPAKPASACAASRAACRT